MKILLRMFRRFFLESFWKLIMIGRSSDLLPFLNAFPNNQWQKCCSKRWWSLQQRDCTGFTPVSLLILFPEYRKWNQSVAKVVLFFWNWKQDSSFFQVYFKINLSFRCRLIVKQLFSNWDKYLFLFQACSFLITSLLI